MKKTLLALAVAGVVAAPAAMADVTVYGLAHVSLDNVSGDLLTEQGLAVTSRASRVGVKAAEDLGGGLTAVAQMEWQVDMADNGGAGNLTSRNQIVGLAGGFGTVAVGRHDTPYKMSTGSLDVFADTAADYNTIIGATGLENRASNAVAYLSPDFNGLSFQAAIVAADLDTDADGEDDNTADATSVAVQYKAGPLFLAAAMESFEDEASDGGDGHSGTRLGVGYDAGVAKIGFVYETASNIGAADDDYTAWLVNAAIPFGGSNAIIAEYGVGEFDDADDETTLMAVGVAHNFSKSSSAYVAYGNVAVDAGPVDDDSSILTAGMVVKF